MFQSTVIRRCLVLLLACLPGLFFATASTQVSAQDPQTALGPASGQAIGTAFTYQGRLTDNGAPANGQYDLIFALFNAENGGVQIGGNVTKEDVVVKDGYFTTQLDFGSVFNGDPRFLEIGVRPGTNTGTFTPLIPRRVIQPSIYAIYADSARFASAAGRADTAGYADAAGRADTAGVAEIASTVRTGGVPPILVRRYFDVGNNAYFNTGISRSNYWCVTGGYSAYWDINEADHHTNRVLTYVRDNTWWIGIEFASHFAPEENPTVDLVCFRLELVENLTVVNAIASGDQESRDNSVDTGQ